MMRCLLSVRLFVVVLAAVVTVCATFMLGQWQLRRAAEKQALKGAMVSQSHRVPLTSVALASVGELGREIHRPVSLRGVWRQSQTLFLDNRPMADKTGFWVYTPFALEGSDKVVIVQRGWVARDFLDRTKLPVIENPAGVVTINGRIAPPPSKLYAFKGDDLGKIRQNIDLAALRKETGMQLLEASVVQLGEPSEGLRRNWPAPDLGVDRHYGYAFQWFSLCALTLILFGWFQVLMPYRRRRSDKMSSLAKEPA